MPRLIVILMLLLCWPAQASAQADNDGSSNTRLYINVGYESIGLNDFDDADIEFFPDTGSAFLFRGGVEIGRFLAFEGDLAFGDEPEEQGADVDYERRFGAFVRGRLPLGTAVDLSARVGYGSTKLSGVSYEGLAYGGGLTSYFGRTRSHGVRLEYTRIEYGEDPAFNDDGDLDSNSWSLAYVYRF